MKRRLTGLIAVVLMLTLVFSMGVSANGGWDWDNDKNDSGKYIDKYDFGWNIASSFKNAVGSTKQGQPIPFAEKSVYDAVAAGINVYLGQVPLSEGETLTVAKVLAAEKAGMIKKLDIGGFYGGGSKPAFDGDITIGDVKKQGLIVVADKGLSFAATSVCCNDVYGYNCQTANRGNAGDFNESTLNGTAKIMNLTPAMLQEKGVFHQGKGYGAWLMLSVAETDEYTIYYNVWNDVDKEFKVEHSVSLAEGDAVDDYLPEREGAVFSGWKTDAALTDTWDKPATMPAKDMVVYGKFTSILNKNDHVNYLMGYPNGTVAPEGSITRAEVSTIFFRLLTKEKRDDYFTDKNDFSDMKDTNAWYHNPVSTLTGVGILNGYPDGTFMPQKAITRGELAKVIALFTEPGDLEVEFSDIDGHWAKEYILKAVSNGWIKGYEDGTFRPDTLVTRAEAVTMINSALSRVPADATRLHKDMVTFTDCKATDENGNAVWYYVAIQEAANNHTYKALEGADEQWLEVLPAIDWTEWEKIWAE